MKRHNFYGSSESKRKMYTKWSWIRQRPRVIDELYVILANFHCLSWKRTLKFPVTHNCRHWDVFVKKVCAIVWLEIVCWKKSHARNNLRLWRFGYLETAFEDFLGLSSANGAMYGDFFVTSDTEGTDGVTSFGEDRLLSGQLFQNFGGSGQSITGFTDANVEAQFSYANFAHYIFRRILRLFPDFFLQLLSSFFNGGRLCVLQSKNRWIKSFEARFIFGMMKIWWEGYSLKNSRPRWAREASVSHLSFQDQN